MIFQQSFGIALSSDDYSRHLLLRLCNEIWQAKQVPETWRTANVVAIFKSGSTALPKNYRPISLLCVGYKALARLMLNRLRVKDVEDRLRPSQFGFRAGRSTSQAIFLAKRVLDRALAM